MTITSEALAAANVANRSCTEPNSSNPVARKKGKLHSASGFFFVSFLLTPALTSFRIRGTVIQEKTSELGRYLTGRCERLDFSEPARVPDRTDSGAVREAILSLTQLEASKRGIGKSTLHYLRKKAKRGGSFTIRRTVRERLGQRDTG